MPDANGVTANVWSVKLLRLPFRIRTGQLYRIQCGTDVEIAVWNDVLVPIGMDGRDVPAIGMKAGGMESLFSRVAVITAANADDNSYRLFESLETFNRFIVAYATATNTYTAGGTIRRFTDLEYVRSVYLHEEIECAVSPTNELIAELFTKKRPPFLQTDGHFVGSYDDMPKDLITKIPKGMKLSEKYICYEFAVDAASRMLGREFTSALLFAVIAFEGAHSAFLHLALHEKYAYIDDAKERGKAIKTVTDSLLKDAGITALNTLTPALFMAENERPTVGEIKACEKALQIRNDVMHCIVRSGEYRFRHRTTSDIMDGYRAAMAVYRRYIAAIERRWTDDLADVIEAEEDSVDSENLPRPLDGGTSSRTQSHPEDSSPFRSANDASVDRGADAGERGFR